MTWWRHDMETLSSLPWWRHQMETFSASLALCTRNPPVTGEFPTQRPVTRSFDVFFALCLNKWLIIQSWGWWFQTPSRSLWRHCNDGTASRDFHHRIRLLGQRYIALMMITLQSVWTSWWINRRPASHSLPDSLLTEVGDVIWRYQGSMGCFSRCRSYHITPQRYHITLQISFSNILYPTLEQHYRWKLFDMTSVDLIADKSPSLVVKLMAHGVTAR